MTQSMTEAALRFREFKPDVVVINHSQASMAFATSMRDEYDRLVVMVHAHTDWTEGFLDDHETVDQYLCVSEPLCEWLRARGVPTEKVGYFRNAVDDLYFHPQALEAGPSEDFMDEESGQRVWEMLSRAKEKGEVVLGYVGRVSEEKRVHLIVEAYYRLRDKGRPVRLLLLGAEVDVEARGIIRDRYEEWTRGEGNRVRKVMDDYDKSRDWYPKVIWPNQFVEDIAPWYALIDIFLLASEFEGLPLSALEAAACGTPVVVPNVGDCSKVLPKDPGAGCLYSQFDDEESVVHTIASAVEGVLDADLSLAEQGLQIREHVSDRFGLASVGGAWESLVLGQIAKPHRVGRVLTAGDEGEPVSTPRAPQSAREVDHPVLRGLRPKVAVVYDSPDWAFHRIAKQVKAHLSDEFEVAILPYWPKSDESIDCDLCCALPYNAVEHLVDRLDPAIPVITCAYDQTLWTQEGSKWEKRMDLAVERSSMLLAASPHLMEKLPDLFGLPTLPCFDGVDASLFVQQPWRMQWGKLRVGWCGNADETYHGKTKGLHLIREACNSLPFAELVVQDRNNEWKPIEEMPRWYRDVDIYVCMSVQEGTPNPVLEASACGRPWVSTDVGIVRELHQTLPLEPGDPGPGLIIERSAQALIESLEVLFTGGVTIPHMGKRGRAAVEAGWDWTTKVEQFRAAFRCALEG